MGSIDFEVLNGHPKCTLIERTDRSAVVVRPGFRKEFFDIEKAKAFIESKKWQVNISFIHGYRKGGGE